MSGATARELLAKWLHEVVGSCHPWGDYATCDCDERADTILASPALDALVAERIAALTEDEAALNAVWDAMESHGHNGVECRPEKPMDYTAVYVIHALAAVLAERRSSDG